MAKNRVRLNDNLRTIQHQLRRCLLTEKKRENVPATPEITPDTPENYADQETEVFCEDDERAIEAAELSYYGINDQGGGDLQDLRLRRGVASPQ